MNTPLTPEDEPRRRILRMVALALAFISGGTLIGMLFALVIRPGLGSVILVVAQIAILGSAFTTLAMLKRYPIWWALLPIIASSYLAIIVSSMVIDQSVVWVLSVLVIVSSLTGRRDLTALVAAICSVTGVALMIIGPVLRDTFDLGGIRPLLLTTFPAIVFALIWLTADQLMAARDEAVRFAEGRTVEAEGARREAESARREAEERQVEQARLLDLVQSLELPVLSIGSGVLAVPLIGSLDSRRLDAIRGVVLDAIVRERSHTVVFDITGIADVDTVVAHGLITTAQSVRLLGARPLISGVRAPVAQTLAGLGVSLEGLTPVANLQEALQWSGDK